MRFISILFLSFFKSSADQVQDNDLDNLFENRWVVRKKGGDVREMEHLEFVICDSPQAANLPPIG